jgi:hypothetical protein
MGSVPCRGEPPCLVIGMQEMCTTAGVDTVLRVAPPWVKTSRKTVVVRARYDARMPVGYC